MSTPKSENHEHELPEEQSHLAVLKDFFSEGKFAEFWRHLGFSHHHVTELQSKLTALESEVPQRHKWTHASTNVVAAERARSPEPSPDVLRPGRDHSA